MIDDWNEQIQTSSWEIVEHDDGKDGHDDEIEDGFRPPLFTLDGRKEFLTQLRFTRSVIL